MTDRSNYGPVRRLSPSVSTDNRKPYSRTGLKGVLGTLDLNSGDTAVPTPSDSPYYPFHVETPQLEAPTQNRTSIPDGPREISGFPTYEQYQRIEGEYLSSLSERKQPKALISQALFDKIFGVLQNGSEDRGSTAQFRFWVRKMFVLAYPQTSFNHNAGGQTPEPVVLHDKRPVAIKEQLYEVLCYCHAVARHGGRDKTCATLRLNYSWVPKELTAKFVKACPTCTLKRSGNPDLLSQFGQTVPSSSPYAPSPPTVSAPPEPASLPVFPGGPNDSPPPQGLSFVVGSEGCDDGGGGGSAGFGPSMFATPDLSVYPSPTLSAGSLGPTTPSPYLPSGLFGYPAVFDPGHGSFASVAGWDTSCLSPCGGFMYPEELNVGISERPEAPVQLQLPTRQKVVHHPLCTRAHSGDCDNAGGDDDDGCSAADSLPRIAGTQYTVDSDMNNIDPVLLMKGGGYSPFALVESTQTATDDAEADMDTNAGGPGGDCDGVNGSGGPYLQILNLAGAPNESSLSSNSGSRVFQHHHHNHSHAPPPPQLGLALGTTASSPAMGEPGPASNPGQRQRQRQRRLQLSPPTRDASSRTTTTTTTTTTGTGTDACSGSFSSRDVVPESLLSLPPPSASLSASSNNSSTPQPMPTPRGDSNPLMNMIMFKFAQPQPTSTGTGGTGPSAGGVQFLAAAYLGMGGSTQQPIEEAREEKDLQLRVEDANVNVFDNTETRTSPEEDVDEATARCRRCRWDSPEAWLVQSDSIDDEKVSVAAMA